MKYCRNCGMLLEDTHQRCIKCDYDVSIAANYSLYPLDVEESLKKNKEEKKNKTILIIVLLVIFVVLIALVGLVLGKMSSGGLNLRTAESVRTEKPEEEVLPEAEQEAPEEPETVEETVPDNRDIKDDAGDYFVCAPQFDAGGNRIFNAIYPEDLTQITFDVDTERYSNVFPELMSFIATDAENTVRFTYMSPQQLWYKNSEKGHTRKNERDPQYYMSFLTFESADAYIDSLVKSSYPKAKKIELVSSEAVSDNVTQAIEALSQTRKDFFLSGEIGDYAHLGEDTAYATMNATCTAYVYEYQITDASKDVLYCKFYVPVISNDLYYATDVNGDMGTITEWYVLALCGIETGNDMLYEDYLPKFDFFCANAVPTHEFFFTNAQYELEIQQSIEADIEPALLDENKLKGYSTKYSSDAETGTLRTEIEKFVNSYGTKSFSSDSITIHTNDTINVVFYDKDANRLFISPDEAEYPGNTYEQLSNN